MKEKIFAFLIDRRHWILGVMLLLSVGAGLLVPHINVNTDMTKYLPNDSPMKTGIDRMSESFPNSALNRFNVRAMYRDLDSATRDSIGEVLRMMPGVEMLASVQENGEYTLYELTVMPDGDPKAIAADIRNGQREVLVETSIDGNLPDVSVFVIAAVLVFLILFLMCESWMEPLLFLFTIGVAVVLNMGSNALLPSVSMTTNGIVAILQLVLSIDYSIILMNRYRQEKNLLMAQDSGNVGVPANLLAMRRALANATSSVLASALTTIAGMLMLCFMKFRIGLDLGIVLAKGVLCSIVCLYTVLPSLIIAFDKAIARTHKKVWLLRTDKLARFEYRFRAPLAIMAVVVLVGSYFLHNLTNITFSTNWPTTISEQFPRKNSIVLLYNNKDEDKIIGLADALALDEKIDTVVSYPTLMLRKQNAEELYATIKGMSSMMDAESKRMVDSLLTPDMMSMVLGLRNMPEESESLGEQKLRETVATIQAVENIRPVVPQVSIDSTAFTNVKVNVAPAATPKVRIKPQKTDERQERTAASVKSYTTQMEASAMARFLGFDEKQAHAIYRIAGRGSGTMSAYEFVHFVSARILSHKIYSNFVSTEQRQQLLALQAQIDETIKSYETMLLAAAKEPVADTIVVYDTDTVATVIVEEPLPEQSEMTETQQEHPVAVKQDSVMEESFPDLCLSIPKIAEPITMAEASQPLTASLVDLIEFLTTSLVNDPAFNPYIDSSMRSRIGEVHGMVNKGVGQLKGKDYSMAAIVTSYPDEGGETQAFLEHLRAICDETLGNDYFLIGESVMFDEMQRGFGRELMIITLLTILVIFLIVALTFRSVVVPAILIATVLSAEYINVFVSGIGGGGILYLAYLIVQSILMGATIDYAILFNNYYREHRRAGEGKQQALQAAYRGSIRTIMTSGLIIVLAPGAMSVLVKDFTISSIVGSLAIGGLAAIVLILVVLPGVLAVCDRKE